MKTDRKIIQQRYREKHREELRQKKLEYTKNNKEIIKESSKKYRENNKEQLKQKAKEYREENKEMLALYKKKYREEHKEEIRKQNAEYRSKTKEKRMDYKRTRKINDPLFFLQCKLHNIIYKAVKQNIIKDVSTLSVLGCSCAEFKTHLESQFESWMTWENYGKYNGEPNYGWDIDHIIPNSHATTEEELIKLNHYTNLQPLCSYVNRDVKRDSIIQQG